MLKTTLEQRKPANEDKNLAAAICLFIPLMFFFSLKKKKVALEFCF